MNSSTRLDYGLDENHLRYLLYTQMRKSQVLALHLVEYKKTPIEKRTYEALLTVFRTFLRDKREEDIFDREHKAAERRREGPTRQPKSLANTATEDVTC